MMALLCHRNEPVLNESLERWEAVGSGGFGRVYKARHKDWGFDVAIKILHDGVCTHSSAVIPDERALCEEANHMEKASCQFVLTLYGIYEGCPPTLRDKSPKTGIVMEYMDRGCVQSLLENFCGPPPWPLVFRLAHQVALGMNFLHSRKLMHHDLKPSNVLLNDDLNAKLADFGLCRVSTSALHEKGKMTEEIPGSYKFMPPEAFNASYDPVRTFDIYSYGVLLWCIMTGKEPYPGKDFTLVALRIPLGDRPPLDLIDTSQAEGLKELVDLMTKCWQADPSKRPNFKECLAVTEKLFSNHKWGIHAAVHEVLTKLDSSTSRADDHSVLFPPRTPHQLHDSVDGRFKEVKSTSIQVSVSVSATSLSVADKVKFVDTNRAELIRSVSEVMSIAEELGDMVHDETYSKIVAQQTSQDKMRMLYHKTLRSGGEKVKAAFYDALKKHHPMIVERLGG